MTNLVKRFIDYVKIDTQSDPKSDTVPSTEKQKDLSKLLVKQLNELGYNAYLDDLGYVYCKVDKNVDLDINSIGLIAHVDTSPDAPGNNVNPQIIKNYTGETIVLNENISMNPNTSPALKNVIGDDLITTDGNTLLGADDKAGVAIIMEFLSFLKENKNFKHGDIYVCFTPDEEIGRGADHFDYEFFKADFAYTLDGSEVGGIEYENFNAASSFLTFIGKSIHPGSSKGEMINSQHLAFEFHSLLPTFLNPAYTEHYEGFNHLSEINGSVEETKMHYIIRNHDKALFEKQKEDFINIQNYLNKKYGYDAVLLNIKDSYYNMFEIIKEKMEIIDLAKEAITNSGITPVTNPIRGGTDGARLTYGGLLTPNLGTGSYNFHGRMEFVSINQMEKSLDIVKEIINLIVKKELKI